MLTPEKEQENFEIMSFFEDSKDQSLSARHDKHACRKQPFFKECDWIRNEMEVESRKTRILSNHTIFNNIC